MSKPPKIDRKSLKQPDEFQKRGTQFLSQIPWEKIPLIRGAIVLVVIGLGYFGYQWWAAGKESQSWTAFHKAMKETDDKRWDALSQFFSQHGSSRAGYFAAVTLADHYFDASKKAAGKPEDEKKNATSALEWYDKAIKVGGLNAAEEQLLLVQRGGAFEVLGKLDEAQQQYSKASELQSPVGKPIALLSVGRVWELKKDQAKALEFYQRVATEFPDSQYASLAKGHVRRLKSPIFVEGKKS